MKFGTFVAWAVITGIVFAVTVVPPFSVLTAWLTDMSAPLLSAAGLTDPVWPTIIKILLATAIVAAVMIRRDKQGSIPA